MINDGHRTLGPRQAPFSCSVHTRSLMLSSRPSNEAGTAMRLLAVRRDPRHGGGASEQSGVTGV